MRLLRLTLMVFAAALPLSCSDDGSPPAGDDASTSSASEGTISSTALPATDSSNESLSSEGDSGSGSDPSGTGSGTGTGTGTGSGTDSSGTDSCEPVAENGDAIMQECMDDGDCPDGYTCFEHHGVVLQLACEILCEQDCECPFDTTCQSFRDKQGEYTACAVGPE